MKMSLPIVLLSLSFLVLPICCSSGIAGAESTPTEKASPVPGNWSYTDYDKQLSAELQQFLPPRVFDFHAHLYRTKDLHLADKHFLLDGPSEASVDEWQKHIGRQVGKDRLCGGLFMGMPSPGCDIGKTNEFVIKQLKHNPGSRGLILVSPDTPQSQVEEWLQNREIVGFKPYYFFSHETPVSESSLEGYCPDWMWRMAEQRGLMMTIHLVRHRALADPVNQTYLRKQCLKYPHAKIVLAHCGRGFHAPNTLRGLSGIIGLKNVWFDTSGICESDPIVAVVKAFGVKKLLWGTDFSICEMRGKCVTIGDSFYWIQPAMPGWEEISGCKPTLVGLESLRAVHEAADALSLTAEDLDDIFYQNARNLLKMP